MTRNRKVELSTIIGKGTIIEGDVKVEGGIRVDGTIKGKIKSNGFVTIGPSGEALADIDAKECLISGKVKGNILAEEGLELDKTSKVEGNLTTKLLTIHAGAVFVGTSKMSDNPMKSFTPKLTGDEINTG